MSRTRSRKSPPVQSYHRRTTSVLDSTETGVYVLLRESVTDNPPGYWKPFNLDRTIVKYLPVTGQFVGGPDGPFYDMVNFVPYAYRDGHVAAPAFTSKQSKSVIAAAAAAQTNPSTPEIDLPLALAELRELPMLLKMVGESVIRSLGRFNLAREFAIKPLLGDIKTLFEFTEDVQKRVKYLRRLQKEPVWRKGGDQAYIDLKSSQNVPVNSSLIGLQANRTITTVHTEWACIQWTPVMDLSKLSDASLRLMAEDMVLGMGHNFLSLSTLWESLPWSWLIDWFSNVGDIIAAGRRSDNFRVTGAVVMRETKVTAKYDPVNRPDIQGPCYVERVIKTRSSASVQLGADVSFLTERQAGILGSLAIVKGMRGEKMPFSKFLK